MTLLIFWFLSNYCNQNRKSENRIGEAVVFYPVKHCYVPFLLKKILEILKFFPVTFDLIWETANNNPRQKIRLLGLKKEKEK